MEIPKIAIVGGGPGGLLSAYQLRKRSENPLEITIFEASSRLGGKILTSEFDRAPIPYEAGAAELYDYSHVGPDPLRELVEELGLVTHSMTGNAIIIGDRILRNAEDILEAMGSETLLALQQFEQSAKSWMSPEDFYNSDWKEGDPDPLIYESFQTLLSRIENVNARRLIEVMVHSDLATEPHRTSAMYGLQNYLMNFPAYMRLYSIEGGIERIPQELARRIDARVMLESPVIEVTRSEEQMLSVIYRQNGETVESEFDYVIIALPNNWIPAIEWGSERLDDAMQKHHRFYDYPAHYLRVTVLFDRNFWAEFLTESFVMLDEFGGCCLYDETSRQGGTSFGILGWLIAGESATTLSNLADPVLIKMVLDALPSGLKQGKEFFLEGRVHRWIGAVNGLPAGVPPQSMEARHQPEPIDHPNLMVVGDYLFDSTLNGVMGSADFVAEWVLEEINHDRATILDSSALGESIS